MILQYKQPVKATIRRAACSSLMVILLFVLSDCKSDYVSGHSAIFSVRDYGARGDGKNDDAPAVRAAIAAAAKSGGGTVHFPAGTYLLKKAELGGQLLTLPSNVSLVSDEEAELVDTGHRSSPLDEWEKGPLLRITGANDCKIRGLHFKGAGQAIYMRNVQRIIIRNCRFTNHDPMAIYGDRSSDVEIGDCHFESVGYGLYLRSPVKWFVHDSRFLANGRAIEAQGAVSCKVSGNFVDGKGQDGKIHGIVGFLFFPNSMASKYTTTSVSSIARKISDMLAGSPEIGGASTVGNIISNNEVRNVSEEGISLDSRGNAPKYYYGLPGMVATADKHSFTDAFNEAEELKLAPSCYVVILSGKGAGQYRRVNSVKDKKLFISPLWDVVPDKTSRYCLLRAAVANKIIGNKVVDVELASIMLFGACLGNEVRDNTVVRSRSSGIQCGSLRPDVHKGMSRVLACFDNRILENHVSGVGEAGKDEGKMHPASGIVLRNWYGGEDDVQNYRNSVINNVISNFKVGINVRVQNGAVVRGNTIKNCGLPIKRGDHLTNTVIERNTEETRTN